MKTILLRTVGILCMVALLLCHAWAAEDELYVYPDDTYQYVGDTEVVATTVASGSATYMTTSDVGIDLIIYYEGFTATRMWDVSRYSIGYGSAYSKALEMFPEIKTSGMSDDEVTITEAQARALLQDDLSTIEEYLNTRFIANNIVLNQNQFDALVSLTYNVGTGWWTYTNDDGSWCLLRRMLLDDTSTWTEDRVTTAFCVWRKAGGVVLAALEARRTAEAKLFLTPYEEEDVIFTDVSDTKWYYTYVMQAYSLGLMKGTGGKIFAPEAVLTRSQAVQVLANLEGVDLTAYKGQTGGFSDVSASKWYAPAVAWAAEAGLINGYDDGTFRPEDAIQRQHLCSIIARYLRQKGVETDNVVSTFKDDADLQSGARANVYFCAALNLVNGVGNGYFDPTSYATRAQAAKILVRMTAVLE